MEKIKNFDLLKAFGYIERVFKSGGNSAIDLTAKLLFFHK